jgi:hypothetical protein
MFEKKPLPGIVSLNPGFAAKLRLTKTTVTTAPTIVGPPKSQIKWGSTTALEQARLTMYAIAVLKRLMAETRPLMLIGARE